jgi:hypothetical protein
MNKRTQMVAFPRLGLHLVLICSIALPNIVLAGGKPYPMEGTVTALGTSTETIGGGDPVVATHVHRTYTLETPTRVFVVECPYVMGTIFPPHECGGKKKIAIGDAVHFRIEHDHAYVLIAPGKDQRLRVVSEGLNEAGNTAPATSRQP